MKAKSYIYLAIGLCLTVAISHAFADGPDNSRWDFLYAFVAEKTPYVVITDTEELYDIQCSLLQTTQGTGLEYPSDYRLYLDTTEVVNVPPYSLYHDERSTTCFKIVGSENVLNWVIGFKPGDKVIIHRVTQVESGPRVLATIDKIAFSAFQENSFVILKCLPLEQEKAQSLAPFRWGTTLIAYGTLWATASGFGLPSGDEAASLINTSCPAHIEEDVALLAESYIPPATPEEERRISVTPIRYVDQHRNAHYLYATVIAYGSYGVTGGILYLLDSNGGVIQSIEGRSYARVIGPVDFGPNRSQALAVFWGDRIGGVELLAFPQRWEDPPRLETRMTKVTVFD